MLRIKSSAGRSRSTDLHAPMEQFRAQGLESTAGQRCARKSTEFASGSKIVRDNQREMENSLFTQDSTHRGFC